MTNKNARRVNDEHNWKDEMITASIKSSSATTAKMSERIPCSACVGYADPNDYPGGMIYCTCDQQEVTLSELFGSEGIRVYIPAILLQGMNADETCYDMQKALNTHFGKLYEGDSTIDTFLVMEEYEIASCLLHPRVVFSNVNVPWIQGLRTDVIAFAEKFISDEKVKALTVSSDFFDHAVSLCR